MMLKRPLKDRIFAGRRFMLRMWWRSNVDRLRSRMARWLGVDGIRDQVRDLQEARRAAIAVDSAMRNEKGYVIMLMPRRGGDLVKVWEIPGGMTMIEQGQFIRTMEQMVKGDVSLMDAPMFQRHALDDLRRRRAMFQDEHAERAWPHGGPYHIGMDLGNPEGDRSVVQCSICSFKAVVPAKGPDGRTSMCSHLRQYYDDLKAGRPTPQRVDLGPWGMRP